MTRNKKGSRGKKAIEREFDSVSVTSSGSMGSEATDADPFDEIASQLLDLKLGSKLAAPALQGLNQLMSAYVLQDKCASWETTLSHTFSQSIKRGRSELAILGARGFSLLILNLGLDDRALKVWETIQSDLIPKSLSGKPIIVRCASLDAVALGCFVVEEDFFKIKSTMEAFSALWKHGNATLVAAAIRGWTLMLSSLTEWMAASASFDSEISTLRAFLESDVSDLQEAAGRALALLYTLGMEILTDSDDGSDTASVCTSASQMDEMRDRMRDLSEARGPRKGKKTRALQKAVFRNICSFIEDGHGHETKIKLQYGDVLTLTTLEKHIQRDFVRSILQHGFHRHLHDNTLMHDMFNFRPRRVVEMAKLTKLEKRNQKSPHSWSSKLRTQTRDWERVQKEVYLHSGY